MDVAEGLGQGVGRESDQPEGGHAVLEVVEDRGRVGDGVPLPDVPRAVRADQPGVRRRGGVEGLPGDAVVGRAGRHVAGEVLPSLARGRRKLAGQRQLGGCHVFRWYAKPVVTR